MRSRQSGRVAGSINNGARVARGCHFTERAGAPAALAQAAAAAAARTDEWASIERDNVVRALAGVLQGKDTTPETINEFLKRKGYELVLAQLPEPKRDLGAITAQSVCQTPANPPSANCAGTRRRSS